MKETIAELTGAPVSKYDRDWQLTLKDFGCLQQKIDMPHRFRILIGLGDIMRWCNTPKGIDECLKQAAKKCENPISNDDLEDIPPIEKAQLVADILENFAGEIENENEDEDETEGDSQSPLAG